MGDLSCYPASWWDGGAKHPPAQNPAPQPAGGVTAQNFATVNSFCMLQIRNYRTEGYKTDNGSGNSKNSSDTSQPGAPHKEGPVDSPNKVLT